MNKQPDSALFKILGHPERLAILRRLMAGPATLTQLGAFFKQSPAHIRHHLVALERAGLVEFAGAKPVQGGPEKYYRAMQDALFIHEGVLPELPEDKIVLTIGSMDEGIKRIARTFALKQMPVSLFPVPLSSLDGLIALRQGLCQMSTCHLIDMQSGEYNRSFVRHLFPGQSMSLVQVYRREEGLMVSPGNPLGIRLLQDLARPDVLFVNREPGSGVRQWLELNLSRLGIQPGMVCGYSQVVQSHGDVARFVHEGKADTGIGIAASAREFGLDFVPLFDEPYEIIVSQSLVKESRYAPFFEYLNSGEFRSAVRGMEGYRVSQTFGEVELI